MLTGNNRIRLAARDIAIIAICAALMFATKMALLWLPNIHLGALFIIVFTITFRYKVFYIVYLYVLLEILVFSFNPMWSVGYLYVWSILAGLALLFRKMENPLGWAILAGAFGLSFGALMLPPFLLIMFGPQRAFQMFPAYWVSGIMFDIAHCVGNFATCFFLYRPLTKVMSKIYVVNEKQSSAT